MLSGSVCQMGQEAGLAGVAATGLENCGDSQPCSIGHLGRSWGFTAPTFLFQVLNLGCGFGEQVAKPAESWCVPGLFSYSSSYL